MQEKACTAVTARPRGPEFWAARLVTSASTYISNGEHDIARRIRYFNLQPDAALDSFIISFFLVHEHFASPLLQFADDDKNQTFTLVEHPGGPYELDGILSRLCSALSASRGNWLSHLCS